MIPVTPCLKSRPRLPCAPFERLCHHFLRAYVGHLSHSHDGLQASRSTPCARLSVEPLSIRARRARFQVRLATINALSAQRDVGVDTSSTSTPLSPCRAYCRCSNNENHGSPYCRRDSSRATIRRQASTGDAWPRIEHFNTCFHYPCLLQVFPLKRVRAIFPPTFRDVHRAPQARDCAAGAQHCAAGAQHCAAGAHPCAAMRSRRASNWHCLHTRRGPSGERSTVVSPKAPRGSRVHISVTHLFDSIASLPTADFGDRARRARSGRLVFFILFYKRILRIP